MAIPGTCRVDEYPIAQTYLLGTADAGARITVTVTAANSVTSVSLGATPTAVVS